MKRRGIYVAQVVSKKPHMKMSCAPQLTLTQRSLYMERIPQNTCINEDLPHKETPLPLRNKCRFYTTIKTQNPQKSRYA